MALMVSVALVDPAVVESKPVEDDAAESEVVTAVGV